MLSAIGLLAQKVSRRETMRHKTPRRYAVASSAKLEHEVMQSGSNVLVLLDQLCQGYKNTYK